MIRNNSIFTIFAIIAITSILMMPTGIAYGAKINGTPGNDIIVGTNGKDTINGKGGNDIIFGEKGGDTIKGAGGQDAIFAGAGNDQVQGGMDNDFILGQDGNDDLSGGEGDDRLFGNAGDDVMDGGTGDDDLHGGDGNDELKGGQDNDDLFGGNDNDSIAGSAGDDNIHGENGDDVLFAGPDDDHLFGGFGDDQLVGNLLRGVNTFDCGPDTDSVWWDGGFTGGIIPIGTDALGDIFADDVIVGDSCEPANIFDLFAGPETDPDPPGDAPPIPPPSNIPDAITDLSANLAVNLVDVDLSWTLPNDNGATITAHLIERSVDGGPFLFLDNDDGVAGYTDTTAVQGSQNTYRVSAINSEGTGSASNEESAFPGLPLAPTALTAAVAGMDVDLSWSASVPPAVTGYQIEKSEDGGPFLVIDDTSPVGKITVESGFLRLNVSVLAISSFRTTTLRACSLLGIVGLEPATISVKNQWYVFVIELISPMSSMSFAFSVFSCSERKSSGHEFKT